MCKACEWEAALDEIDEALADVGNIPPAGADFAASVEEKLQSIREWIETNQHVTEAQETAIGNMADGIRKWT